MTDIAATLPDMSQAHIVKQGNDGYAMETAFRSDDRQAADIPLVMRNKDESKGHG